MFPATTFNAATMAALRSINHKLDELYESMAQLENRVVDALQCLQDRCEQIDITLQETMRQSDSRLLIDAWPSSQNASTIIPS